ncbi:hypothetical protein [Acutalibacter muris]|uniref:hypothetical protein n=1 Tax=Acutalibacter muris TaxID=1796620 RepID=UPI001C3ECFE2|nr:hypothetical protein [Acutalibacter muris]
MFMNVLNWESEWEHSHTLADSLKKSEKNGNIQRLCFMPGGWACFRSEGPVDNFLRNLSIQCGGKVITHMWWGGDDCGSSLWQDGRESRNVPSVESPEWDSLAKEVADKTAAWEACAAFHEKLDSCWETYIPKLRELTLKQIQEQSSEIAATMLCYGQLSKLSWQKTWIEYLNRLDDPLAVVRDALLAMLSALAQEKFDAAMWGLMDKADIEQGHSKEVGQEQTI